MQSSFSVGCSGSAAWSTIPQRTQSQMTAKSKESSGPACPSWNIAIGVDGRAAFFDLTHVEQARVVALKCQAS